MKGESMEEKIVINEETYIKESSLYVDIEEEAKKILLGMLEEVQKYETTTPDMLVACARVVEVLKD